MPVPNSRLYVMRDDTSSGHGLWWCVWAVPGESIFCGMEGYCSRRMYRTRRDAASYGERMEGEKPIYWPASSITAPFPKES
jgi:hypothetical protein